MKIMKIVLAIFTFFMLTSQIFSFPFLREEGPVFIVEIQSRPFSFPSNWVTPAITAQMESVTEDYAIFVWNKPGKNIVGVFSGDDLRVVMEEYRSSVFSRFSRVLLKLEVGKNRILNGRVVEVQ